MTAAPTVPPVVRQWAAVLAGLLDLSGGALDDDQPELWLAALRRWMDDPADRAGLRAATDAADHVVQAEINRHFLADRRAAFPRTLGPAETLRRLDLPFQIVADHPGLGRGDAERFHGVQIGALFRLAEAVLTLDIAEPAHPLVAQIEHHLQLNLA